MSNKDGICLYDKNHTIQVCDKNREVEERNLNITINNISDILQIKIRDPQDYCFNYTENIDLGDFEIIRLNQNLDINFNEFKYNLVEMLQQFQKKEMFLRCEISNQKCTLVFYCKSKIKSVIYLTIDLNLTNQKEIFSELLSNMQYIQETNEKLKKQLSTLRKSISEKDQEINNLIILKNDLEKRFQNNLKQLSELFNTKIEEVQMLLISKIVSMKNRVVKSLKDVELLKREVNQKSESSKNLIKSLESLQLDANSNMALIHTLKKENSTLHATKFNQDRYISDLQKNLQEKDTAIVELRKKNNELQGDMEKVTLLLTQKKATIDELSKDLVQANQLLVNFNNHCDNKARQVEELQEAIVQQKTRTAELLKEFESYRASFNNEEKDKLKHELLLTSNKADELEKALRKANKINALLTEKVNNPSFNPR
ncbi:protein CHUP1, chloroplastic-like isoform X2 [Anoplophora glabripennis]|uniref:protein CHUP1, chloroplastic-like isoform X2 n=1 Tax=Anoplophora glabripennis TaxID=217634 RepID=UPI0008755531|nr:protein CHUP1, chloroplastic-like isoform X2 [Anoplophora glabripennis]